MKVICVTMTSQERKGLWFTIDNLMQYCKKHGYDIEIIEVGEDNKWEFKKHEVFKELMENEYDLIFYKDDDSLITNLAVPIESFIDDYYSFYLTKDFNEFNGGSVIIKNTEVGRWFNDMVLEHRDLFENEQNFYNSMPMLTFGIDIMKPIPHPSINSYKYELYPECKDYVGRHDLGDWRERDFILHVPALSLDKRIEVLKSVKVIE